MSRHKLISTVNNINNLDNWGEQETTQKRDNSQEEAKGTQLTSFKGQKTIKNNCHKKVKVTRLRSNFFLRTVKNQENCQKIIKVTVTANFLLKDMVYCRKILEQYIYSSTKQHIVIGKCDGTGYDLCAARDKWQAIQVKLKLVVENILCQNVGLLSPRATIKRLLRKEMVQKKVRKSEKK